VFKVESPEIQLDVRGVHIGSPNQFDRIEKGIKDI